MSVGARLGRARLLALLAVAGLGGVCSPAPKQVRVYLEPAGSTLPHLGWATVRVMVDAGAHEIQAMDLSVQVSGGLWIDSVLKAQFDDDGEFFLDPQVDSGAGTASDIVDLRHGANPATGTLRLVRLRLFALNTGTATVSVTKAALARPDGTPLSVSLTPATFQIGP